MLEPGKHQPSESKRRIAALVLLAAGILAAAAGLFGGLQGLRVSESFTMSEARQVRDGMHLYRLDLKQWPEPPFLVIDDARYGKKGTRSELEIDGKPVSVSRASTPVMVSNESSAFLHTGVGNIYFSSGPEATAESRYTIRFTVLVDSGLWVPAVVIGCLVLLAGLALLIRVSLLFDAVLLTLIAAMLAGSWLTFRGIELDHPLPLTEARALSPHGYITRVPRVWPLSIPTTDRNLPSISGWLLRDGERIGDPTALSPQIRNEGDGAHLMIANGVLYFSLPGNVDPAAAESIYEVRTRHLLPLQVWVFGGLGLLLVIVSGLLSRASPLSDRIQRPLPGLTAVALPLGIAAIVIGYLSWLWGVDALHFRSAPKERDWFAREEGWRMAGLTRSWPFEGIIAGTSVSQNFYMEEAASIFGMPILNASIAGSAPADHVALLRQALRRNTTKLVIWEIHMTGFQRTVDAPGGSPFPEHLFDRNPLNDLEYFFSLQAWLDANEAITARKAGRTVSLDPLNKWGERLDFGPEVVANAYCERRGRPPAPLDEAAFRANLRTHVVPLALDYPDTHFSLFVPAYSVLMHLPDGGRITGLERTARIMLEELGTFSNVSVHDFQGIGPVIGDPSLYRDDMHYHPSIGSDVLQGIKDGTHQINVGNAGAHEDRLRALFSEAASPYLATMNSVCEVADG